MDNDWQNDPAIVIAVVVGAFLVDVGMALLLGVMLGG